MPIRGGKVFFIDFLDQPTKEIKIAMVILSSLYGEEIVRLQRPFTVYILNGRIWVIEGRLSKKQTFSIWIQHRDYRVLHVAGYNYDQYRKKFGKAFPSPEDKDYEFGGTLDNHIVPLEFIPDYGYTPDYTVLGLRDGVVKDPETAANIGRALRNPHIETSKVKIEKPFSIYLTNGVWKMHGYVEEEPGEPAPPFDIWIQRQDGRRIEYIGWKL